MMKKEKVKVYIYTRVSTAMQIDGYSLDAQKSRMKAYAEFNDYEIVGEYEDAGKSGKSIETVCLLSKLQSKEHTGLKGSSLDSAQVKQKCGIIERENYNKPKSENTKQSQCPPERERAITEALKHFGMI